MPETYGYDGKILILKRRYFDKFLIRNNEIKFAINSPSSTPVACDGSRARVCVCAICSLPFSFRSCVFCSALNTADSNAFFTTRAFHGIGLIHAKSH